jgi:hypothetical protein
MATLKGRMALPPACARAMEGMAPSAPATLAPTTNWRREGWSANIGFSS